MSRIASGTGGRWLAAGERERDIALAFGASRSILDRRAFFLPGAGPARLPDTASKERSERG